jgi:hypothetical protein
VRRLALIVACIAVLGAGAVVWISGADATVAHKPASRLPAVPLKRLTQLRQTPLRPGPLRHAPNLNAIPGGTCYVGAGSCSGHPCVEFAASSSAVYQLAVPSIAAASPLPAARSRCRAIAAGRLQRVGAAVVTVQSAPVSVHQTGSVQLVR